MIEISAFGGKQAMFKRGISDNGRKVGWDARAKRGIGVGPLPLSTKRNSSLKTIQSDLGAFTNEVMVPFLDKFEICVVHSSVSHPPSSAVIGVLATPP
ncbi:hypothetical protein TNCV_3142201 [Trichonephila clavipes]|nr:hypothetical protein TNCV_3142201 [Trichonephila clavipes]